MKRKFLMILALAALVFTGCKSFTIEGGLLSDAQRAKAGGNYHAAVMNVVESIRIDNEYADALIFLRDTYPEANSYYSQKISERKSAGGKFSNDEITKHYEYLKAMNEAVRSLPVLYDPQSKTQLSFSYTDYSNEISEYREYAAEDHYQEGIRLMQMKGRENAKQASREFETALSYVPNYKDAERRAQKTLEDATQVIAFFPFQNNAWNIPTEKFSDLIQNAAISDLLADKEVMKFTKIIDRSMQESLVAEQVGAMNSMTDDKSRVEIGHLLNANIFLTGSIESSELIGPSTTMNQYHRQRQVEIVQEVPATTYTNGTDGTTFKSDSQTTTQTIYKDIYADVYHYRKFIRFNVTITYKVVDVETGAILLSNTINREEVDSSEWAEWSGDEDALTWEDTNLINSYESAIMTPQQIASEAARSIGADLAGQLKNILR